MKKLLTLILLVLSFNLFSSEHRPVTLPLLPEDYEKPNISIPMIPLIPSLSNTEITTGEDGDNLEWILEDSYTFYLDTKVKVVVPLEIISDVDIKALVIDNEKVTVPFQLELNREPNKKNNYTLNYSETEIDIDKDGRVDTYIYSPKYINKKIVNDNYLFIDGENITKDGVHTKKIYVNIELKERG